MDYIYEKIAGKGESPSLLPMQLVPTQQTRAGSKVQSGKMSERARKKLRQLPEPWQLLPSHPTYYTLYKQCA